MTQTATSFLDFEPVGVGKGVLLLLHAAVLARVGTVAVHHGVGPRVRVLRYMRVDLICYLDDAIFGAGWAREALQSAQHMLSTLEQF